MQEKGRERPMQRVAEAFEALERTLASQSLDLDVQSFSHCCELVSPLIGCVGDVFKFAEMDYVAKVEDLKDASKSISLLPSLLELDIKQGTVREVGSHSRNLLRVKRGLDMLRILFEQILIEGNSVKRPASVAYEKAFAHHHGWVIRKAVAAGLYALPTSTSYFIKKLNEDEASARIQMQKYVVSSAPVIRYVEQLFLSRGLGIDW